MAGTEPLNEEAVPLTEKPQGAEGGVKDDQKNIYQLSKNDDYL